MKQIIMDVLDDMSESQINLASETARKTIAGLISATLNDRGRWIEFDEQTLNGQRAKESWVCDICGKNTYDVDWDYIGSGTNHLGCELKLEMKDKDKINLKNQIYTEMTADGLPPGGDVEAVLESKKLAEQIIKTQEGSWIYESPDGGKTIYKRPFGDYNPENKIKLTKEEWDNEKKQ
jgi:hypothetical protein